MVYRSLFLVALLLYFALAPGLQASDSSNLMDRLNDASQPTLHSSRTAIAISEHASLLPVGGQGHAPLEVSVGDRFAIIDQGKWIRPGHGGAHGWMTVLTEDGHVAYASYRDFARVMEMVDAEDIGISPANPKGDPETDTGEVHEVLFAVQSRYFDRDSWFYVDDRMLLIPVEREFSYTQASEHPSQYSWQWQREMQMASPGERNEVVHPEKIVAIDLTVEFAGGSGVAAAFPFEVLLEDFTGNGDPEFGVRNRSVTVTAVAPYMNETLETYWFQYDGTDVRQILRNVDRTVTLRGRIDYTHVGERDSDGLLTTIRSYAAQRMRSDKRPRIDKSVRELEDGRYEWIPGRSRLTRIVPDESHGELRTRPRENADIRDWVTSTERIRPTGVHVTSSNEVWLKVDEPRGPRGWIPEVDVRWLTRGLQ